MNRDKDRGKSESRASQRHRGSEQDPPLVPKELAALLFTCFTLVCVLLALGAIALPATQVEGQVDAQGNAYTGKLSSSSAEFVGSVHILFSDGASYTGALDEGRFSGEGTFVGADGWSLEGTFAEGRLVGEGSYLDAQGSYAGAFENSLPHGKGIYSSAEGWEWEGLFSYGAPASK
jgi:hypothetical protein